MESDRPWLGKEPSARPDTTFRPGATAIGAFTAVALPIVLYGITRQPGADGWTIGVGILAGLVVGLLVALVLLREDEPPPEGGARF